MSYEPNFAVLNFPRIEHFSLFKLHFRHIQVQSLFAYEGYKIILSFLDSDAFPDSGKNFDLTIDGINLALM